MDEWVSADRCTTDRAHKVNGDDLPGGGLGFLQLSQEVPKTRLCNNDIRCKDSHPVQLWCRIGSCWEPTADNLVFLEASLHGVFVQETIS